MKMSVEIYENFEFTKIIEKYSEKRVLKIFRKN